MSTMANTVGGLKMVFLDSSKKFYVNGIEVDPLIYAWIAMGLDAWLVVPTGPPANVKEYTQEEYFGLGNNILK
jgi:hypothetical protein